MIDSRGVRDTFALYENKPYHFMLNDKVYIKLNDYINKKHNHLGGNDYVYDKMIIIKYNM